MAVLFRPYFLSLQTHGRYCAIGIAVMLCACNGVCAATGKQSPTVSYTVRVLSGSNNPEIYNTPSGLVQWHSGLPIPIKDTIQVVVTAVDTNSEITGVSGKIDGKALPTISQPTWQETVVLNSLQLGDHFLEITASLSNHHPNATLPLKFTSVSTLPQNLVPVAQTVVSSVKGDQQLLQQGNVANVDSAAMLPPVVGVSGQLTADSGVDVGFIDDSATSQRKAGQYVTVNGELMAVIVDSKGSQDKNFVFMLVRDGSVVYSSKSVLPVSGAGIKLVAATENSPGLLPGDIHLYVWGVDDSGNYSAPSVVDFTIKNNLSPVLTKP